MERESVIEVTLRLVTRKRTDDVMTDIEASCRIDESSEFILEAASRKPDKKLAAIRLASRVLGNLYKDDVTSRCILTVDPSEHSSNIINGL
jgi:hypothetical protein